MKHTQRLRTLKRMAIGPKFRKAPASISFDYSLADLKRSYEVCYGSKARKAQEERMKRIHRPRPKERTVEDQIQELELRKAQLIKEMQ